MQLGIRLHDLADGPLPQRIADARAQGFTCGQLAPARFLPAYPSDAALTPGLAFYLKRLFWDAGIDIAVLGCYLNLAHPEPAALRQIQARYEAHLRFAALLGCGMVGTETGAPNADYRYCAECRSEAALAQFIANLRPVVAMAEKLGVLIGLEPVHTHIVYNAARAKTVLDAIQSPNLQIIFDPVNLLDADNYTRREALFDEVFSLLGDAIAAVHLKDFAVQNSQLVSVPIASGLMDYAPFLRFIKNEKPFLHTLLEETTPANAAFAVQHLQNVWHAL